MSFGQELRQQREGRGISLDDVAVSTRISLRHLHALEEDRFADLPGGVFNRGIVRSYATCCGLDPEETVRNFQIAFDQSGLSSSTRDDDWREFAQAVQRNRTRPPVSNRLRWLGVLGMLLAVLLAAVGVLWVLVHRGIVHLPEKKRILAIHHTR